MNLARRLAAEGLGTGLLLATVVGSGIMGAALSQGNDAVALLANAIATGAILVVLITMFGSISGAHFNPAVTLTMVVRRELALPEAMAYVAAQVAGGVLGVWAAHFMFEINLLQASMTLRTGPSQWFSEAVATFGLVATILAVRHHRADMVAAAVGLYITAGYWFTSSTSFANPAVTLARGFTDTFSGIAPQHVAGFIAAQVAGALVATALFGWLLTPPPETTRQLTGMAE